MAPVAAIRPENIIKTCENLIKINNSDEALDILKNFIGAKKFKYISAPAAESIGLLFVQLCVEKRDFRSAKEGLYSYKKNVQTINNGLETVGTVVRRFIQHGEKALSEAKKSATSATEDVSIDLDEVRSPEAVLLSIVSNDDNKDRSDREILTPYLRFMYDSYRAVLDIIRNTKQLEVVYCYIVSQSFKFCEQYGRKQEFKKISELIRNHLQSINFYANQSYTNSFNAQNQIDLSNPTTLERFLQLRFNGLNIAVKLELYQESFKIVEDIHTLLVFSKRQPKPSMMLNYYENLAKIFNVSVNTLYRSVSWLKFFNLYSQSPNATLENLKNYASIIVLSSLSVSEVTETTYEEDKQKFNKLSKLLNLHQPPTRQSVIDSINNASFLKFVDKDLKMLFQFLENEDFNPLFLQSELVPILDKIHQSPNYKVFFADLLKTVVIKIFKQIAKNYENIKFEFLLDLTTFKGTNYELSPVVIENALINAGKDGLIPPFRIDHDANIVSFTSNPFESDVAADLIKVQLSKLSNTLLKSLYNTDATYIEQLQADKSRALALANEEIEKERQEIEERRVFLEKRRQEEEEAEARRIEAETKAREEKLAAERQAELERQEQEALRRAEEKQKKQKEEIMEQEKLKKVNDINKAGIIYIDPNNIKDLDIADLRQMQMDNLTKDQKDTQDRMKALFKRNDHLERAFRKYELKLLEQDEKTQKQKDIENYNLMKSKLVEKAKKEHEDSIKLRDRLQRIVPTYKTYIDKVSAARAEQIKQLNAKAAIKIEKEKAARIQLLKEQKLQELIRAREQEKEEKRRAEEQAKAAAKKEEEERKKKEELEKMKREFAEARAKNEEAAAKQREREAEIERLLAEKNKSRENSFQTVENNKQRVNRHRADPYGGASRNFSYGGKPNPPAAQRDSGATRSFSSSSPAPRSSESSPAPSDKPLSFAERLKLKRAGKLV